MTEEQMRVLLDSLGLKEILKQNDIEELTVMELLDDEGLLDMEDYFFEDIPEFLRDEQEQE